MNGVEERRTHVSLELKAKRLGLYLEPSDPEDNRGAVVRRFDPVGDGGQRGEAELSGTVKVGMLLTHINDQTVTFAPFPTLVSLLVNSPRPIRLTFRDPEIAEFRDSYRFLRTKLHVEKEAAFLARSAPAALANDKAWLALLAELGGKRGASWGVQRLVRDANGDVTFPLDPSARLNAVSPVHGRIVGLSSPQGAGPAGAGGAPPPLSSPPTPASPSKPPAPVPASAAVGGGSQLHALMMSSSPAYARPVRVELPAGAPSSTPASSAAPAGDGDDDDGDSPGRERASKPAAPEPPSVVVVSIYKRCWGPGSIGVAVPPGLGVPLPGELPKPKAREALHATLARLVAAGGIPAAFRPAVWWELSGAHAKAALHPPGYYAGLCTLAPAPEAKYALDKDVDRTFPGHPVFDSRAGLASLRRLLAAFAVHNPDLGYCQGLNFLAGYLLLLLSEEQAFWVLDCLVNEILPPDYYSPTLIGVHADQRVLGHLVGELLPDVATAYESAGVSLHVVTVEWFMCALVTLLPAHTAVRVWDALFLHGSEALFRVPLVLFLQHRDRILSVSQSSTRSKVAVTTNAGGATPGGGGGGGGGALSPVSGPGADGGAASPTVVVASTSLQRSSGSFFARKQRDTVAETAARVMAAVAASSASSGVDSPRAGAGGEGAASSDAPSTPSKGAAGGGENDGGSVEGVVDPSASPQSAPAPAQALAKGGTVRSPLSTFPALFSMLKSMPTNAHDPDELMRLAFPATPKDAKESLDWRYTAPSRLAKLRAAAREQAMEELGENVFPSPPPPAQAQAPAPVAVTARQAAQEIEAAAVEVGGGGEDEDEGNRATI
jgi:TBC1 domain family member 6